MGVVLQHHNWLEDQLSRRLWLMQQEGTLCDVIIHPAADGDQLHAHSAVIAAASPQIQTLFQSLKEGYYTLRTATIPHHVWNYLLEFIYLGLVHVDEEHVADVRKVARKLEIKLEEVSTQDSNAEDNGSMDCTTDELIIADNVTKPDTKETAVGPEMSDATRCQAFPNYKAIFSSSYPSTPGPPVENNHTGGLHLLPPSSNNINNTNTNTNTNTNKEADITDLIIPSEEDSVKSSSSMQSLDIHQFLASSQNNIGEEENEEPQQTAIRSYVPSISHVMKEASSRRRKSTPRKVIQEPVVPVINIKPQAEVQPTPIPNTPPPSSSPAPSSQNSMETENMNFVKKARKEEEMMVAAAPATSLPLPLPQFSDGQSNFLPFFNPQMFGGGGQQFFAAQLLQSTNQLPFYLPNLPNHNPGAPPPQHPPPPLPGMDAGNQWANLKLPSFQDKSLDPGAFSISDPPEDYNEFIQWVKAVRAKLRISQTALSDALNNEPRLTKRYSQTIISSFETFKMSQKEVAFLRPFIVRFLQTVAKNISVSQA